VGNAYLQKTVWDMLDRRMVGDEERRGGSDVEGIVSEAGDKDAVLYRLR